MDEVITAIVSLAIIVSLIFAGCCFGMRHVEKMADKGFCQTPLVGTSSTYWSKCAVK